VPASGFGGGWGVGAFSEAPGSPISPPPLDWDRM